METVLKAISDWIKSLLTAAIMSNLSGLFDDVNTQVGNIAQQVGTKPSSFEPRVFAMIEALSRNVVLPIAGVILTFIACYELIEMITQHNNMAQFEPALLMKWIFKTAISVWMISNTFDIIMSVFDVTQQVVANSSGIISGNTRVNDIGLSMLQSSMMQMDVGPLFGLFLQSFFIGITMRILSIVIFVIVYGRMIEIYMIRRGDNVKKREHRLFIRVTDEERNRILDKMYGMGIHSLSAYIRKMALDGYCLNLDLPQLRRMAYLLQNCSNNLNQVAKRANENGKIYSADLADLRTRLDELISIGKQILTKLANL